MCVKVCVCDAHPDDAQIFEVVCPGLGLRHTSRQNHLLILLLRFPETQSQHQSGRDSSAAATHTSKITPYHSFLLFLENKILNKWNNLLMLLIVNNSASE